MLRQSAARLSPIALAMLLHGIPAQAEGTLISADEGASTPASETGARSAPPRPMLESRSEAQQLALQRAMPGSQQLTLDGGADPFLSLWLPANQAQPAGLVILVPGEGETADWPTAIGPLRRQLPDYGWSTLSLSLPDSPNPGVKVRKTAPVTVVLESLVQGETAHDESTSEPIEPLNTEVSSPLHRSAAPLDDLAPVEPDHATRVQARLRAAVDFAHQQQPRTLVLLGHGTGAYWAARFLQEQQPSEVVQLVIVSAREPDGAETDLSELLPQLRLATGDFFYRDQANQAAARERLNAGKRQQHPAYLQIGLQRLPSDARAEQAQLVRRVRGWLELGARSAQR